MSENDIGFLAALEEAQKGAAEGGVPIGACVSPLNDTLRRTSNAASSIAYSPLIIRIACRQRWPDPWPGTQYAGSERKCNFAREW